MHNKIYFFLLILQWNITCFWVIELESLCVLWKDSHHVAFVGPGQAESAVHISSLVSHILAEFVDGGGGRQVERQPLIDGLGIGGVLHYTQHSRLLRCTSNL